MFSLRRFLLILLVASFRAQADPYLVPALTGIATSAPGQAPVLVDGRPLLLSPATRYTCSSGVGSVEINNGIPFIPKGAKVAVTGKWDKPAAAWRADEVCVVAQPDSKVSGQGTIDAVIGTGSAREVVVNGLHLRMSDIAGLSFAPPLTSASKFKPGQWLQYTSERDKSGSWLIRTAVLHESLENRVTRNERKWKPRVFMPPSTGQEGRFQAERLTPLFKLPGNQTLQERVTRIGAKVVPAWEQARQFRFYVGRQHALDCTAFPDGTILLPEGTAEALPDDAELAAILAGCVARLEEEQGAQLANRQLVGNTLETASLVAISPIGLVATIAYKQHMHHAEELLEQQCDQAALFYLQTAGYPVTAGPAAWEKLEAKHGVVDLSRPPGARTHIMYQALVEAR